MAAGFQTWLDTFQEQGYLIMDDDAQKQEAESSKKRANTTTANPSEDVCPSPVKKAKVGRGAPAPSIFQSVSHSPSSSSSLLLLFRPLL